MLRCRIRKISVGAALFALVQSGVLVESDVQAAMSETDGLHRAVLSGAMKSEFHPIHSGVVTAESILEKGTPFPMESHSIDRAVPNEIFSAAASSKPIGTGFQQGIAASVAASSRPQLAQNYWAGRSHAEAAFYPTEVISRVVTGVAGSGSPFSPSILAFGAGLLGLAFLSRRRRRRHGQLGLQT